MEDDLKPVVWLATSRKDLRAFPQKARADIGHALYAAQMGDTDPAAKALKGFGGAKVMEIVERHDTNTYRAVYTAHFAGVIYVLHTFQKKSKKGIATPKKEIDLIRQRLTAAEQDYRERQN